MCEGANRCRVHAFKEIIIGRPIALEALAPENDLPLALLLGIAVFPLLRKPSKHQCLSCCRVDDAKAIWP